MPEEKMRAYSPEWDDERVLAWDGNFRSDSALMMACCERPVNIEEYRRVMEQCIAYRNLMRDCAEPLLSERRPKPVE